MDINRTKMTTLLDGEFPVLQDHNHNFKSLNRGIKKELSSLSDVLEILRPWTTSKHQYIWNDHGSFDDPHDTPASNNGRYLCGCGIAHQIRPLDVWVAQKRFLNDDIPPHFRLTLTSVLKKRKSKPQVFWMDRTSFFKEGTDLFKAFVDEHGFGVLARYFETLPYVGSRTGTVFPKKLYLYRCDQGWLSVISCSKDVDRVCTTEYTWPAQLADFDTLKSLGELFTYRRVDFSERNSEVLELLTENL